MQRLIDEYAEKVVVDPDSFLAFVYKSVHAKVARDVPFKYFESQVHDLTDFPEIMHVAEELEKNYKKIENRLNEII